MSVWDELGIVATDDIGAIRAAYAARLKQRRPEEDRDGFQRLRAAYETVLRVASFKAEQVSRQAEAESESIDTADDADPGRAAPPHGHSEFSDTASPDGFDAESRAASQAIVSALSRKDPDTAAHLLETAINGNLLPLGTEFTLREAIAVGLLNDRSIPTKRLFEIARKFGWYDGAGEIWNRKRLAERQLCARIDAEFWLAELKRRAQDVAFYFGGHRAAAARLLLGKGKFAFARIAPPEPPLSQLMAQLSIHWPWIGHNFDETRIKQLQEMAKSGRMFLGTVYP